jgi:pSer/pThr/pTyr-binding forkhead associated (FHA) protein
VHPAELLHELALVVSATATDRGWRIGGPASVAVAADPSVGHGRIEIEGHGEPGPLPAWAQLIDARGGRVHLLADNRCGIGRAPESDVEITEPRVSRHHATIFRRQGGVWILDAGSANGTYVNDVAIFADPIAIEAGDAVRFGPATFTFKML